MKHKNKLLPFSLAVGIFLTTVAADGLTQQTPEFSHEDTVRKSQEYYTAGKKLLEEGNYTAADEAFKKAQGLLVNASPALVEQIAAPLRTTAEEMPAIASLAEKALEASKKEASQEAINLYLKALELAAENPNLHYNLGVEYLKAGEYKKAAESFKKVITLNPKDADAYYNLGALYESYLQDKTRALVYYTRYLKFASQKDTAGEVKEWIRQIKKELRVK